MKKSIKVDKEKKPRGRPPTGRGTLISSRIPPAVVVLLDAWASKNDTTRSDAIRALLMVALGVKDPG
jgi:hypothetical protein